MTTSRKCELFTHAASCEDIPYSVTQVSKVTDLKEIMAFGVMMTPALAVNGTVKVSGRVPSVAEIKSMLQV